MTSQSYVPNIIEFVESKGYLGLPHRPSPIQLYPWQRRMLLSFYRTPYSYSYVKLSNAEQEEFINNGQLDALNKYHSGKPFDMLLGVLGRRTGKDFMLAIIACYELYKLMQLPCAHTHYGLLSSSPITILCMASTTAQAAILRREVVGLMQSSTVFGHLFQQKNGVLKVTSHEVSVCRDKVSQFTIRFTHSNADAVMGVSCIALLLSEAACFKEGVAQRVVETLSPSLATFLYSDRELVVHRDGKIVVLTTPRRKGDFIHKLFENAPQEPNRLVFQLPTWVVDPRRTREQLREECASLREPAFDMEFGARFAEYTAEDTEQVTFRLRTEVIERLKRDARKQAFEQDKDVSYTDIIREIVEERYGA